MKQKIHLVMPMAGAGSRFFKNGFVTPKPLIEINDKPFLFWATKSISHIGYFKSFRIKPLPPPSEEYTKA